MSTIESLTAEYEKFLQKAASDFQATVESANAQFQQLLTQIPTTEVKCKQPPAQWIEGEGLLLSEEAANQFMALFATLGSVLEDLAKQAKKR